MTSRPLMKPLRRLPVGQLAQRHGAVVDERAALGDDEHRAAEEVEVGGARDAVGQIGRGDEQPVAGRAAARARADGGEPASPRQLGDADAEAAADGDRQAEVHVRVVEAGDDGASADVEGPGAGPGGPAGGGLVVAGVGHLAVDDGERRGHRLRPATA